MQLAIEWPAPWCPHCPGTYRHTLSCPVTISRVRPLLGDAFDAWCAKKKEEGWEE